MKKFKHLSKADRMGIEHLLNVGTSFKEIGKVLERDPSGIREEVKRNSTLKKKGAYARPFNDCANRVKCTMSNLCNSCPAIGRRLCKLCGKGCSEKCNNYIKENCFKLNHAPYVCNGCTQKLFCTLEKNLYTGREAQHKYELFLNQNKNCVYVSQREINNLEFLIRPFLKKGHSIHHICAILKDEINVSERTLYSYIDKGVFKEVGNLDLPSKVRYRKRKVKKQHKIDTKCREGRSREDYLKFINGELDYPIVQLDSVEGVKGGRVLLTIHFTDSNFMLAFLRERNTSASVIEIFDTLEQVLSLETFRLLFPILLTDNGTEFSNPLAIEMNSNNKRRTYVFYCDPSSPEQKGSLERNHEFIRKILPKGTSFDNLTQSDINLVMCHINSYLRPKFGDKSPYEIFSFIHGEEVTKKLGIQYITPENVILKPSLLTK